jgi:hypothetical protein
VVFLHIVIDIILKLPGIEIMHFCKFLLNLSDIHHTDQHYLSFH